MALREASLESPRSPFPDFQYRHGTDRYSPALARRATPIASQPAAFMKLQGAEVGDRTFEPDYHARAFGRDRDNGRR